MIERILSEYIELLWVLGIIIAAIVIRWPHRFASWAYLCEQAEWHHDGRAANEAALEILRRIRRERL